jgi:polyisoprenoid-binding protein YceI
MKLFFVLSVLISSAQAEAVFNFDPRESHASFTLSDVLHPVHGTFQVKRGSIHFDSATGSSSGEIVVDATSGDSGNGARDKRMHGNILESQKYPEISFIPSRIRGTVIENGESKVEIDGTFTIHGAAHPLTASATVTTSGDRLRAKVHFTMPYVSWGIKNPSTLFLRVGETVDIDLDASGHIAWR